MSDVEPDGLDELVNMVMVAQYEAAQEGKLAMWIIYNRPADYRDGYIARMHESDAKGSTATNATLAGGPTLSHLNLLRNVFANAGLIPMDRHPDDDLTIVEVWM